MKIEVTGSYSFPEEVVDNWSAPRPRDILMFLTVLPENDEILTFVRNMARRFSDRNLYVRQKRRIDGSGFDEKENPEFKLAALGAATPLPTNVIDTAENSYRLMLKGSYAFCTRNTTIAVEAMQAGLMTFIVDPSGERHPSGYWRNWPDLIVANADEAVKQICDIENHVSHYPWSEVSKLTVNGPKDVANAIRRAAWPKGNPQIRNI